jgi:hypothetical protein
MDLYNQFFEEDTNKIYSRNDMINFAERCLTIVKDTDVKGRIRSFVIEQIESINQVK